MNNKLVISNKIYFNEMYIIFDNVYIDLKSYTLKNRNRFMIIFSTVYNHLIYYPTPSSFNYYYGFGFLAGISLSIQLVTGIILVIHYKDSVLSAFDSVAHLIYDVPSGWLIRYLHANGASIFFIVVFLHIGRGLYYGSFITPRNWVWITGIIIFFLLIGTSFIGYVLPWGQISFWGATVITTIITSVPLIGASIVFWVWGDYAVGDTTLNRFFSLHYLLPFVILAVVIAHIYLLHNIGSGSPLGLSTTKLDLTKVRFYIFFYLKDIFTFFIFLFILFVLVFFSPNLLGHADNYILADPIITPAHIVPEWYFLPFYAVLRAVDHKLLGVILILGGTLVLLLQTSIIFFIFWIPEEFYSRSILFLILNQKFFWLFVVNFIILGYIGSCPVEIPYYLLGKLSTYFFFLYWFITPIGYTLEQALYIIEFLDIKIFIKLYNDFNEFEQLTELEEININNYELKNL
jgi:quinol-cytochrome oxidoreductase complex cytochrome b subunit